MTRKQLYIFVAALVVVIFAVGSFMKGRRDALLRYQKANMTMAAQKTPVVSEASIAPSIEDVQGRPSAQAQIAQQKPSSLSQMYSQYSKEDAGGNMVAAWAKVPPEEKERVIEQLDQEISRSEEALKVNPQDKKAKQTLFISSTLRKLCKVNFDYSLLESISQDQGGLKPKYKK